MKRTILAALFLGAMTSYGLAGTAASDIEQGKATIVYDQKMADEFKIKREIVDQAQQAFGETAAYETPQDLPDSINAQIVPGNKMPADAPTKPVPAKLGDLPKLTDNSHWVATGNHLVEVSNDSDKIVMVVYNALP